MTWNLTKSQRSQMKSSSKRFHLNFKERLTWKKTKEILQTKTIFNWLFHFDSQTNEIKLHPRKQKEQSAIPSTNLPQTHHPRCFSNLPDDIRQLSETAARRKAQISWLCHQSTQKEDKLPSAQDWIWFKFMIFGVYFFSRTLVPHWCGMGGSEKLFFFFQPLPPYDDVEGEENKKKFSQCKTKSTICAAPERGRANYF